MVAAGVVWWGRSWPAAMHSIAVLACMAHASCIDGHDGYCKRQMSWVVGMGVKWGHKMEHGDWGR